MQGKILIGSSTILAETVRYRPIASLPTKRDATLPTFPVVALGKLQQYTKTKKDTPRAMLPPLKIEIPSPTCWQEIEALRDVADTDRLSPTGDSVDHIVTVKVACLSGITANRPMCRDISSNDYAAPPPENMKAMVAIFRNSDALGSSCFSQPLSLSSSRMFSDDSVNRFVAIWHEEASSDETTLKFEVPMIVSNGYVHSEEFELLVFLADHSKKSGSVMAYPIGIGTFQVGDQLQHEAKSFDLRIQYVNCRTGFPAMEIKQEGVTATSMQSIKFTNASGSPWSHAMASTYKLDDRGGGFVRMKVGLQRKDGLCYAHPYTAGLEFEPSRSSFSVKDDKKLEPIQQIPPSPIVDNFVRENRSLDPQGFPTETTPQSDFVDEGNDGQGADQDREEERQADIARNMVAEKIAANLKFPNRPARKPRSVQSKGEPVKNKIEKIEKIDRKETESVERVEEPAVIPETQRQPNRTESVSLNYKIGKRSASTAGDTCDVKALKIVPSPSLSFDDESLLRDVRPQSPSGVLSLEGTKSVHQSPSSKLFKKFLQFMENLTICGGTNLRSDVSVAASKLSLVDTWNTFEDDDNTLEKGHQTDNDTTFLEEFVDSTWSALNDDVIYPMKRIASIAHKPSTTSTGQAKNNFWNVTDAQEELCHADTDTIESVRPKRSRRRSREKRSDWV